jgi:hypothetical protein
MTEESREKELISIRYNKKTGIYTVYNTVNKVQRITVNSNDIPELVKKELYRVYCMLAMPNFKRL